MITDTASKTFSSKSLGSCSTILHFRASKSMTRTCSQIMSPWVDVLSSSNTRNRNGFVLLVIGQTIASSRFKLYAVRLITSAGRCPDCSLPLVGSKSTQMMLPCFTAFHDLPVHPNHPSHIYQVRYRNLLNTNQAFF